VSFLLKRLRARVHIECERYVQARRDTRIDIIEIRRARGIIQLVAVINC